MACAPFAELSGGLVGRRPTLVGPVCQWNPSNYVPLRPPACGGPRL